MDTLIIPLGEECYTCQSIDAKFSNSFRKYGFPFDYVGHTFVEKIYDNLIDMFKNNKTNFDITDYEKICETNMHGEQCYFGNIKYGFRYWHDIIEKDDDCNIFIDKYNRRYTRLYELIKESTSIIFLSVNHFDNIYKNINKYNEIIKLYELLYSINTNIKFLAINYNDVDVTVSSNLHFINLPVDRNLFFEKSKDIFTKTLYEYVANNIHLFAS